MRDDGPPDPGIPESGSPDGRPGRPGAPAVARAASARLPPSSDPSSNPPSGPSSGPPSDPPPHPSRPAHPAAGRRTLPGIVIGLALALTAVEAVLWAADMGIVDALSGLGAGRWRRVALQYGAFWSGLLQNWQPNYRAQPAAMFATYSMLHSGPAHLAGNLLALAWLGPRVVDRFGAWGFVAIWAVSALAGAATFGALSRSFSPMVGASGALFGLMGALVMVAWRDGGRLARVLAISAGLAVLNLAMLIAEGGILAWQTHLGGYLAGLAMAAAMSPRNDPDCAMRD